MSEIDVAEHLGLAWVIAEEERQRWSIREDIIESDLLSVAYLAMVKTARAGNYDASKGKLTTYLGSAIRRDIRNWIFYENSYFRIPLHKRIQCARFRRDYGELPDIETVKQVLGVTRFSQAKYKLMKQAYHLTHAKVATG